MLNIRPLLLFTLVSCATAPSAGADNLDLEHAKRAVAARLESLRKLHVSYNQVLSRTPPPRASPTTQNAALAPAGANVKGAIFSEMDFPAGKETDTEDLFILDNNIRYETVLTDDSLKVAQDPKIGGSERTITIFSPTRYEILRASPDHYTRGFIDRPTAEEPLSIIDLSLGMRVRGEREMLTPKDIEQMDVSVIPGGFVLFQKQSGHEMHQWTFDPKQQFALLTYRIIVPEAPGNSVEFASRDFISEEGVLLPMRIMGKDIIPGSGGNPPFVTRSEELEVLSYKLDDPKNTQELYKMVWPLGAVVTDNRVHLTVKVTSRARTLEDGDISEEAKKIDEEKARTLKEAQDLLDKEGQK